jgi:hypothetical protein
MKIVRVSKAGPTRKGPLKTSQKPLTRAGAKRPASQGHSIVGGYPINFGGGGGKSAPKSGGMKKRGKAMY